MEEGGFISGSISAEEENNGFFDEKVIDHGLITWTVDNFHHLQETPGRFISSPPCHINSESWTITLLPVYLYSAENRIKLSLTREKNENEACAIYVNFRFGIKTNKIIWLEEKYQIRFLPLDMDLTIYDLGKYFDNLEALREKKLTLLCEMYSTDLSPPMCQTNMSDELYTLSKNIFCACGSSQESDVLIRGTSIEDIPAHKAILSSRSPGFNKILNETCSSIIIIPEEDCDHIPNILAYIYSGRTNWIASFGITFGSYECAKKYELRGLVQLLTPSECSIRTTLTEKDTEYTFNIDKFSNYEKKRIECIRSPPFSCSKEHTPLWHLEIYIENTLTPHNNVGVFVINSTANHTQYVNICLSIVDDSNREYFLRKTRKPLFPDFVYGFPIYTTKEELRENGLLQGDKLTIRCKITSRSELHSSEKINLACKSSILEYEYLKQLPEDFEKLYEDGSFADATLVANEARFNVHKIILAMRFPIFTKLLKDKMVGNTITLTDISPEVLDAVLFYAYTGKLENCTIEFLSDVYSVAKTYEMLPLVRICEKPYRFTL